LSTAGYWSHCPFCLYNKQSLVEFLLHLRRYHREVYDETIRLVEGVKQFEKQPSFSGIQPTENYDRLPIK